MHLKIALGMMVSAPGTLSSCKEIKKSFSMFTMHHVTNIMISHVILHVLKCDRACCNMAYFYLLYRNFWEIVRDFSDTQRKRLLAFITGSDRIPLGGLSKLKLIIVKNGPDSDR